MSLEVSIHVARTAGVGWPRIKFGMKEGVLLKIEFTKQLHKYRDIVARISGPSSCAALVMDEGSGSGV